MDVKQLPDALDQNVGTEEDSTILSSYRVQRRPRQRGFWDESRAILADFWGKISGSKEGSAGMVLDPFQTRNLFEDGYYN